MNPRTVTVSDLMSSELVCTSMETSVADSIATMTSLGYSSLPVIDEDHRLLGMFSERHAIRWIRRHFVPRHGRMIRSMLEPQYSPCSLHQSLGTLDAMGQLLEHRVSCLPVVDDDQRVIGAFSENNAIRAFIALCWHQLPESDVASWADRSRGRFISHLDSFDRVDRVFREKSFRRLFALHNGRLAGTIGRSDLLRTIASSHSAIHLIPDRIGDTRFDYVSDQHTVSPYAQATSVIHQFGRTGKRRLPVVHEGRLVGQLSRCDVIRAMEIYFASSPGENSPANSSW